MSLFSKIGKGLKKVGKVLKGAARSGVFGPVGTSIVGVLDTMKGKIKTGGITMLPGAGFGSFGALGLGAGQAIPSGAGMASLRVLPSLGKVGTAIGAAAGGVRRFLNTPGGKWTRKAIRELGLIVIGALVYDAAGNLMGTTARRRMNPLNARALRRAIRRVKSARGICHDVESMLPRRKASTSRKGVNVTCH